MDFNKFYRDTYSSCIHIILQVEDHRGVAFNLANDNG